MASREMKQVGGFWLPMSDTHFEKMRSFVNSGRYQTDTLDKALQYVKKFDIGIDVGAHVGIMSRWMSKRFTQVVAFEPSPMLCKCFKRNNPKINFFECALSNRSGLGHLKIENRNCGLGTLGVKRIGHTIPVPVYTLDFCVLDCDFLKIDVEGHEDEVVLGGLQLINKCKPVIMLEEVGKKESCRNLLRSLGYSVVESVRNDHILVHERQSCQGRF